MRVLVLGATGFIGGAVARAALAAGHEVVAARRTHVTGALDDAAVEWRTADLLDRGSLASAMQGCEVVFHAAGYYPTVTFDRAKALRRGVTGMRHVLAAARDAGVRRVVYTSSLSTVGKPEEGRLSDERDHYLPGDIDDTYWELKWAMEQECWRACAEGLDVVVTNPTMCFGPGDVKPTSGMAVILVAKRRLPVYTDGAWNVVDVRDVAQGQLAAAERGRKGERYLLGGHNITVSIFLHHVAKVAGVPPPRLLLPGAVVRTAALASELFAVATRRPPLLPVEGVDMIRFGQHFDCAKAEHELGLAPRPLEQTLQDAVAWFRARHLL